MAYVLADPESRLNWSHDWSDWLAEDDTITSRLWTITALDGSPGVPALSNETSDIVFVEPVGSIHAGKICHLTEHVVTASGLEDDRTLTIRYEHL